MEFFKAKVLCPHSEKRSLARSPTGIDGYDARPLHRGNEVGQDLRRLFPLKKVVLERILIGHINVLRLYPEPHPELLSHMMEVGVAPNER